MRRANDRSARYSSVRKKRADAQNPGFGSANARNASSGISGSASPKPIAQNENAQTQPLISRRTLLIGAAGIAGAAAVAGTAVAVSNMQKETEQAALRQIAGDALGSSDAVGDLSLLSVANDQVFTTENCTYIESADDIAYVEAHASLPYGTLVWASDDEVAACLLPTETASPLTQIGLLSLSSGSMKTIVDGAVSAKDGFEIFDVRANKNGVIWTESNVTSGAWRIYHAPLSGMNLGEPVIVADEDGYWELPDIAMSADHSFWQMVPNKTDDVTSYSKVTSRLMSAPIGGGIESAKAVYEAKGFMACAPTPTETGIAFVPRADASGVYYQLTYIDAASGEVVDSLTLPSAMTPTDVSYGENGFSFSFDGIYSYGNGISNLGTYTPASVPTLDVQEAIALAIAKEREATGLPAEDASITSGADAQNSSQALTDSSANNASGLGEQQIQAAVERGEDAVADIYSSLEWFRFPRAPLTSPAWCRNWFFVKSTNVVAAVDFANRRYFTLASDGNGESYGEFLASTGNVGKIVTYANLDYTPLNGDPIKECAVRIWGIR